MAISHSVEDAIREGSGSIDAKKLARDIQSGKYLSGELKTIAEFANIAPKVNQPVGSMGTPGAGTILGRTGTGAVAGGIGLATGGPLTGLLAAAAPEAPAAEPTTTAPTAAPAAEPTAAPAPAATPKKTGGRVKGQLSQDPRAVKRREANAAKQQATEPKKKPAAASQAEIDADRERIMGVTSDSIIRTRPMMAESFSLFRKR
jgi:hypothetical protein